MDQRTVDDQWGLPASACCTEITICEPDQRVSIEATSASPNDPLYPQQWNMQAIKAPAAWQTGQMGDPNRQAGRRFLSIELLAREAWLSCRVSHCSL